jgi:hypothetical protein
MYLTWKSMRGKGRRGYDYRHGEGASPLMLVARRFKVPITIVREAIEVQRGTDPAGKTNRQARP